MKPVKTDGYEMIIGLEVHVELKTHSKLFCGCEVAFGGESNTRVCPVCMGLPGALPLLSEKAVTYAIMAGLALNCDITPYGHQDRKQYFYPDSPKAYQISQNHFPIAQNGFLEIEGNKRMGITRIHIEEDAGKLVHTKEEGTFVDFNRCGVPLIEIVSEPDFRAANEVKAYLQKLKATLEYLKITSGKMNEGAFRCDVNLSVRKKGATALGTRTEMKNLNSFGFIVKAIEGEFLRQVAVLEAGGQIIQETRRFDPDKGQSFAMRSKENAHDYRYFPDPDLKPIAISEAMIEAARSQMGVLPQDYKRRLMDQYALKEAVCEQLIVYKGIVEFFINSAKETRAYERLANLILSEVLKKCVRLDALDAIPIDDKEVAALVELIESGRLHLSQAKKVIDQLWHSELKAMDIAKAEDLWAIEDVSKLQAMAEVVLAENPQIVKDFLSGKEKAIDAYVGKMMKITNGRANPEKTMALFYQLIGK